MALCEGGHSAGDEPVRVLQYGRIQRRYFWSILLCATCGSVIALVALFVVVYVYGPGHASPSLPMQLALPYAVLLIHMVTALDGSTTAVVATTLLQYVGYGAAIGFGRAKGQLASAVCAVLATHALGVAICMLVVRWFWQS